MPKTHHLDRRADAIVAAAGSTAAADALLNTSQVAAWLGVSEQWLEIGRSKGGYGPRFKRLGPRMVRYTRGDVVKWLKGRSRRRVGA